MYFFYYIKKTTLDRGRGDDDPVIQKIALDTPELVEGVGLWLPGWEGVDRRFLSGRFVSANWDVEELVGRKREIEEEGLLKMDIKAKLGAEQFGQ